MTMNIAREGVECTILRITILSRITNNILSSLFMRAATMMTNFRFQTFAAIHPLLGRAIEVDMSSKKIDRVLQARSDSFP